MYIFVQVVFMLMKKRMELQTARRWSFSRRGLAVLASQVQSKDVRPAPLGLLAGPHPPSSNWVKLSCLLPPRCKIGTLFVITPPPAAVRSSTIRFLGKKNPNLRVFQRPFLRAPGRFLWDSQLG